LRGVVRMPNGLRLSLRERVFIVSKMNNAIGND
jgi:hypothetical protein